MFQRRKHSGLILKQWKLTLIDWEMGFFFFFSYDSCLFVLLWGGNCFKCSLTPLIQGHYMASRQGFWVDFYFLD